MPVAMFCVLHCTLPKLCFFCFFFPLCVDAYASPFSPSSESQWTVQEVWERVWQLEEADRQGEAVIRREIEREKGGRGREASFTPKKWKYMYHTSNPMCSYISSFVGSSRLHLGCPHRHAAIRPAGLLWLHWHGLAQAYPTMIQHFSSSSSDMVCLKGAVCFVEA